MFVVFYFGDTLISSNIINGVT